MEDPEPLPPTPEETEAERRRQAEEAMEQMLLAQEEEESDQDQDDTNLNAPPEEQENEEEDAFAPLNHRNLLQDNNNERKTPFSYIQTSFIVAFGLIYYALRTRQQWYLALVFLSSSKWAYIILGNFLVALLISVFQVFTRIFLNGLRLAEAEGIGDFFRWNITETCIALTMFRSELNVKTMILFLLLVLVKCLHWVADMRESHLRMTEEAVVTHPVHQWPTIRWQHFKLLLCLGFLQFLDILAVIQCAQDIIQNGPSVFILFAFEGAILLASVISNILLWNVHLMDGIFHYWHETADPSTARHRWIHPWKDHKATLVFAVEVQAQAAKFLFYVTFFTIVMTYYGMPINLFREVYVSFQSLKSRLVAFSKYRQLMANMNRFASPGEEELQEEPTCIICRDEMTVPTTKKLPGCGHLFHKSCLREWLVQQQSCPTCRGDIFVMEARQRQQDLVDEQQRLQREQEAAEQQEEEQQQLLLVEDDSKIDGSSHDAPQEAPMQPAQSILRDIHRTTARASEEEDQKKNSKREKRVRIVPPDDFYNPTEQPAFPAFYRVVQDQGASVYNDGSMVSFLIRLVPFGLVILGYELSWRDCEGEKRLMLRMPDGWVCEDDVERIVAVPLDADR
jgi:E3 ubiquitin-protein ligase synoviolin